jgi:hypothetical protein
MLIQEWTGDCLKVALFYPKVAKSGDIDMQITDNA